VRMRNLREDGFALVLVVMAIALVGLEMFVLTGGSNTMLFQSNTAYLQACERNLVASGLAWARRNTKGERTSGTTIDLDVTAMNVRGATVSVATGAPRGNRAEVQINTSCGRGRLTLRHNDKYRIECE
jgi:hypothetical protein